MKRDSCGLLSLISPDLATTIRADTPICLDKSEDEELFINICAADIQCLVCIQYPVSSVMSVVGSVDHPSI